MNQKPTLTAPIDTTNPRDSSQEYSVVIPTKDRPDFLGDAICSVLQQSRPAGEIIVVDNSIESIRPKIAPLLTGDPRIRYLHAPHARNGAHARNIGLAESRHRFVAFLDDDDEWFREKMAVQLGTFRHQIGTGAVFCRGRWHSNGKSAVDFVRPEDLDRLLKYDNFAGSFSFLVIDTARVGKLALDASLTAFQDWDYTLRLREHAPIAVLPDELVRYRDHAGPRVTSQLRGRSRSLIRLYHSHRSIFTAGPRCWLASRYFELKAREWLATPGEKSRGLGALLASICAGLASDFPWRLRIRTLAKRTLLLRFLLRR